MKYATAAFAIVLAGLLTFSTSVRAQQRRGPGQGPQGTITGTVVDSSSKTPLGSATVAIRSASDSTLVTGAIADRTGAFSIGGLRPGRYYARVSYVGFVTHVEAVTIEAGNPVVDIGSVALAADRSSGNEVTVTGKRDFITLAIDRTIYKTSDLKVAAGGDATDVLRNIPTIEVDQDGNVSLRGSQNVAIQINGRPTMMSGASLAAFLRSLPADAVERVEVIPNPSAKYDPDGMSGIINIVMKQATDRGVSGGINGSVGTDPNATFGANVGFSSGPWTVFANYGFNYERMLGETSRLRQSLITGPPAMLTQSAHDTTFTSGHTVNASVDYALAPSHTLSLSGFYSNHRAPNNWAIQYTEANATGDILTRALRTFDDDGTGIGGEARLGYKWTIEPAKEELSAEVRYNTNRNTDPNNYLLRPLAADGTVLPGELDRHRTNREGGFRTMTGQLDYERPIGESGRLEAGYKAELHSLTSDYSVEMFDSTTDTYVPNTSASSNQKYDRTINAAYLTYSHDFGPLGVEAGVRAEQATTRFEIVSTSQRFDNDYFSLFPSAFLTYKPTDETQLKLSYSRRITRPDMSQLNPSPDFDDPTFRSVGNPYLKPQYTDAYELTAAYYFENGSISINPYFRHNTAEIGRWERFDTTGLATLTWENMQSTDNYGADMVGTLRVGDWLSGFIFVGAYQYKFDASNLDGVSKVDGLIWQGRANVTATLLEGLDLQVTYFYRAPMTIMGGEIGSFQSGDIALVKKLFDDKATIGLRVSDPLKQMGFRFSHTYGGFYESMERTWNSRTLSLTFSYTFGNPGRRQRQQPEQQQMPRGGLGM